MGRTVTHPQTGHECHRQKPNAWTTPREVSFHLYRDEADACWYAEIHGEDFDHLAYGDTPGQAMFMAYDVMRILWDECSPASRTPSSPHCYCRDGTNTMPDSTEVWRYVACCLCDVHTSVAEFEDA
jgi:hypothetical protein